MIDLIDALEAILTSNSTSAKVKLDAVAALEKYQNTIAYQSHDSLCVSQAVKLPQIVQIRMHPVKRRYSSNDNSCRRR
jgi:hypothetical protein